MSKKNIELELLFPEQEVELGGKDFTIRPFSFVETRTVARKLKDVMHLFNGEAFTARTLADVYDTAFDGVVDIIAMVYQLDRETVESFDLQTTLVAINGIIGVNKSFFDNQVGQGLDSLMKTVGMNTEVLPSP